MSTLKGQNFRVCILDSTASKWKVVGMATNCTINLQNNTEEASTKDTPGLASMPTVVSNSWSVQVESLGVSDAAAMLTNIKAMQPFLLMWDETSTTDNQTRAKATFARKGSAYLNDVVFSWNDRENSSKQLQFSGTGELSTVGADEATATVAVRTYTKGQFVRLFLGTSIAPNVVGFAKQLSMHVSVTMEPATTKDTTGTWVVQEPTAISYDITSNALVRGNDTITSGVGAYGLSDMEGFFEGGPIVWEIANVSGDNNRTKGTVIVSGTCIVQNITINNPNRANSDYTVQLAGTGSYTVAA